MQSGVAILHSASSGSRLLKSGLFQGFQWLPSRKGMLTSPSGSFTSAGGIRIMSKGIHLNLSGSIPSARGIAPSSLWIVTSAQGIHPQFQQEHPSASEILTFSPGIHPSAREEAPFPSLLLARPLCGSPSPCLQSLTHHPRLHRQHPIPRNADEMEIPRHLPRGRPTSRPMERGGEHHRRVIRDTILKPHSQPAR